VDAKNVFTNNTINGYQTGGPAIRNLCGKKIGGKGENLVWPLLPKILGFSDFF
jgi:hypothetical protein